MIQQSIFLRFSFTIPSSLRQHKRWTARTPTVRLRWMTAVTPPSLHHRTTIRTAKKEPSIDISRCRFMCFHRLGWFSNDIRSFVYLGHAHFGHTDFHITRDDCEIQHTPDHHHTATIQPGLTFCTKTLLQTGIVCVAAKLSCGQVLATSSQSIPVVVSSVGAGMLFIPFAGRYWAGLSSSSLTLLLTAGTSICGAPSRDIAEAVANTVLFGTFGMLYYPYLLHALCDGNSAQVGMCLGVAIHDTSQVLGSALAYKEIYGDDVAFQVAAVTKLLRNLGLAVAIPVLSSPNASDSSTSPPTMSGLMTFTKKYVPPFLLTFLGMSTVRSTGDLLLVEATASQHYFTVAMDWLGNDLSKYLLGTAMAGVGLGTSASSFRGVGWKPFAVGVAGALMVGGTGVTVATMIA